MSLKDQIVKIKPRETSGSKTSSRYDFQKDWSLCRLLEEHSSGKEYAALFDYLDDFVLIDFVSSDQKIDFYQIKGKGKNNYTLGDLLKRKTDKDGNPLLCVLSKLYENSENFKSFTTSINFVTNAKIKIKLDDATKDSLDYYKINFDELDAKIKKKIEDQVKLELGILTAPIFKDILSFNVTFLSLEDCSSHTKGKIAEFLEKVTPGKKYRIDPIYKSLSGEIKRKTNNSTIPSNLDELILTQGIDRTGFSSILNAIGVNSDPEDKWSKVDIELQNENMSFSDRKKINMLYKRYEVDRMNSINNRLFEIIGECKKQCITADSTGVLDGLTLSESANLVLSRIDESEYKPYEADYVKSILLYELYY